MQLDDGLREALLLEQKESRLRLAFRLMKVRRTEGWVVVFSLSPDLRNSSFVGALVFMKEREKLCFWPVVGCFWLGLPQLLF